MRTPNIENELKSAEKEKLVAETEKVNAEKRKIDLEADELKKEYLRKWIKRKEFWSILIGTLIAWTAVGFYITFFVVPLSEIHVNQATLENSKKSDTLYHKEKQLAIATEEIKKRQSNLVILQKENERQKSLNIKLQQQIEIFYHTINKLSLTTKEDGRIKEETFKLKKYLDSYKTSQNPSVQVPQSVLTNKVTTVDNNLQSSDLEPKLSRFKEEEQKNASSIDLTNKKALLDKVNAQIKASVNQLQKELGDNYQTIQSGKGYDFKNVTYGDRFGLVSAFDHNKKVWPSYIVKIAENQLSITMKDENKTDQVFPQNINSLNFPEINKFVRNYFISRLDELR
jgi:hypothetical protein